MTYTAKNRNTGAACQSEIITVYSQKQNRERSCLEEGRLNFIVITMKTKLEQSLKVCEYGNKYKIKASKKDGCVRVLCRNRVARMNHKRRVIRLACK